MPGAVPITARLFLAATFLAAGCGPVHQQVRPQTTVLQGMERLSVLFVDGGKFTVIDERARGNPGAMAGFGLIGLVATAVEFGTNASSDNQSARSLAAFVQSAECRGGLQAAFEETIHNAGKPSLQVITERPVDLPTAGFDALLEFRIEQCGFRSINQTSQELAAFVELRAKLVRADGRVAWDDRETVISNTSSTKERMQSEPDLARTQFEAVLHDAGRRMANNILYP
jgi:hypothetical protein